MIDSRRFALGAVVLLALLGGGVSAQNRPGDSGRDRTTASDETEQQRRARIRLDLASAYFADGKLTTALDEVKQALAISPDLPQGLNLRGLVYAAMGDEALAQESFQRAMQVAPTDPDVLHNYGWYLCMRNRSAEALPLFDRALAVPRYRTPSRTLLAKGVCEARTGALQVAPTDADVLHNYGWYLCVRDRMAEALPLFDRALAVPRYRTPSRTLLAKGVCEARSGALEAAEATLKRGFELDAGNPAIAMNLADVLLRRGEFERARFYVRRVNDNAELRNAESLWLASRIEHRLGNEQGARDFGYQLRAAYPNSPEAAAFARGGFNE